MGVQASAVSLNEKAVEPSVMPAVRSVDPKSAAWPLLATQETSLAQAIDAAVRMTAIGPQIRFRFNVDSVRRPSWLGRQTVTVLEIDFLNARKSRLQFLRPPGGRASNRLRTSSLPAGFPYSAGVPEMSTRPNIHGTFSPVYSSFF